MPEEIIVQEQLTQENEGTIEANVSLEVEEVPKEALKVESELEFLRAECERMKAELCAREEQDRARAKIDAEFALFAEYFPEVRANEIPQEVWESVKGGSSLSGSYALYLRRAELERKKIEDFNEKNRKMSSGTLIAGQDERYFSPSEVKKMTPAQVRTNYDDIIRSMRHWN